MNSPMRKKIFKFTFTHAHCSGKIIKKIKVKELLLFLLEKKVKKKERKKIGMEGRRKKMNRKKSSWLKGKLFYFFLFRFKEYFFYQ